MKLTQTTGPTFRGNNLENKMEKIQESINKDLEELKNKHTKTNNTITEI